MRNPLSSEFDRPPGSRKIVGKLLAGVAVFIFLMLCLLAGKLWEEAKATDILVIQYPDGSLRVVTEPGYVMQWFGTVERFDRSAQFEFVADKTAAISKTRFNDGAHGYFGGSIRFDLPLDRDRMIDLFKTYRTMENVKKQLVGQNITKAIYFSGPLMSSKESYSDRRNELISSVEDQATQGVYQTAVKMVEVEDPITQQKKWVNAVEVKRDKSGAVARQEKSPLERFGIPLYNIVISDINYDDVVENQIKAQQAAIMQVQTAIAQSKEAEQQARTAEAKGQAKTMEAKWQQEEIKAKAVVVAEQEKQVLVTNAQRDKEVAVTAGEQRKQVAELDQLASIAYKQQQINEGEGEAAKKKLIMQANGALEFKGDIYLKSQQVWAGALAQYKGNITPQMVTGGGAPGQSNAFQNFMDAQTAKAMKDIGLDLSFTSDKKQ